jgi:hypothetical protein
MPKTDPVPKKKVLSEKLEDGVDFQNKRDVCRSTPSPETRTLGNFYINCATTSTSRAIQHRPHPTLQSDTSLKEEDPEIPGFCCGVVPGGYRA